MTIDEKIRTKKMQYDITRKAAKISASWSVKNDKYEYLTSEATLPSDQRRVIEQAKFPLGKALETQREKFKDQGIKQMDAITNKNQRLADLINANDNKDNYK